MTSPDDGPPTDQTVPVPARVALPGSQRPPLAPSRPVLPVDPSLPVEVTLVLRRRAELPDDLVAGPGTVTPSELAERFGADPDDVALVRATAADAGAEVLAVDVGSRRVVLRGTAERLAGLFGTELRLVETADPTTGRPVPHRSRSGGLSLPAGLAGVVVAVLGLDDRPQSRALFRVAATPASTRSYVPPQLAAVYGFPSGTTGAGQTLAIIELGGGYAAADLDAYFGGLGIATPAVRAVGVDGASNVAGADPSGADGEVLLDIEVAGALAPGADIAVYFAPNTDRGFLDALSTAAHATPTPVAVSISWGQSEDDWTAQARNAMDAAMADAAALGVTVTVASGDDGSTDRASDGRPHVDFPASSPHALACGGTSLRADAATGTVHSETVWGGGGQGASGGGVSGVFPLPSWQAAAGVPDNPAGRTGRGVPDVAGDADPATGYQVLVDGSRQVIGGTSAVAPLWAALVCRLAEAAGRRFGLLQPFLYAGAAPGAAVDGLRDITSGTNGSYRAGPGWDPCTGLGVPVGTALLTRLQGSPTG